MAGLSTNGEVVALNALLAARFISLHTADPGNTGASEVAGGGYVRQSAAFTNSGGNPTLARNNALIQFPVATAAWGTITHFGVWSAAAGGTFYGSGAVGTPKAVAIDDIVRFLANAITVSSD